MTKINPYSLKRPARQVVTRTFTDPLAPDTPLTLSINVTPDAGREFKQAERNQDLVQTYVTGRPIVKDGQTRPGPPAQLPPLGGEFITVTPLLCGIVASVETFQCAPDGGALPPGEAYTAEDLLALSVVMPTAFREMGIWVVSGHAADTLAAPDADPAGDANPAGDGGPAPNDSGAPTAGSSASPSRTA